MSYHFFQQKPEDVDFVVVRENSEGLYKGIGEFKDKGTDNEVATQVSYNTRKGVERCLRYAFEFTKKYGKKKLLIAGHGAAAIFILPLLLLYRQLLIGHHAQERSNLFG